MTTTTSTKHTQSNFKQCIQILFLNLNRLRFQLHIILATAMALTSRDAEQSEPGQGSSPRINLPTMVSTSELNASRSHADRPNSNSEVKHRTVPPNVTTTRGSGQISSNITSFQAQDATFLNFMAQVNVMTLMPDQPTTQKYEPSGSCPPLPDYPSSLFDSIDPLSMPSRLPTHWQDTNLINLSDSIPSHAPAMPDGNPFTSLLGFPSSHDPSISGFPNSQSSIQEVPTPLSWLPPHKLGPHCYHPRTR
jgi:hypothetical protein